jgi:hypothetical protein
MIEALLHRKLTVQQENMEDILTSNVFGMLQYAPPKEGLFRFLARARIAAGDGTYLFPLQDLSGGSETVSYEFWPDWQVREGNRERRIQPDVALHIRDSNGTSYLVAIEAKYHSGKSSEAELADVKEGEENDQEADESGSQVETKAVSIECADQVAREWIALVDEAKVRKANPILIYLTAGFSYPKEQILASAKDYRRRLPNSPKPTICWLSWRELADLFDAAAEHPILGTIARMIEQMGLTFFQGISKVSPILSTWQFRVLPPRWRFQVPPMAFCWRFSSPEAGTLPRTWRFDVEPIVSQWRFQESAAAWRFTVAPIVSRWRFKR